MKNLVKNKVVVLLLTVSMVLSGFAMPANAKTNTSRELKTWEGHGLGKLPMSEAETQAMKNSFKPDATLSKASTPAKYDLRTQGRVTSVKNQGDYGLCWTFASMASMESNALTQGLGTYDLSEVHMAYFAMNNIRNPLFGLEGDNVSMNGGTPWYDFGASSMTSTFLLAKGYGPVLEQDAPYQMIPNSLNESLAYQRNVLTVEDVYWVPIKEKSALKQAIMKYGAMAFGVGMYEDPLVYNAEKDALFVADYIVDGDGNAIRPNHDVTVVGWDDNYSKNNFGQEKPKKNGAWLCKNSWGADWGNHDGYFWVSYEDAPSNTDLAYAYVVGEKDEYDNIYQHDGGAVVDGMYGFKAANIFTCTNDEYMTAVGNFMEKGSGAIKVYTGMEGDVPESGKLVHSQKFTANQWGWHSFKLDKAVKLTAGEKFAVVIHYDKKNVVFGDFDGPMYGGLLYYDVTTHTGESLVDTGNGKWTAYTDFTCRIKAYTNKNVALAKNTNSGEVSLSWTEVEGATGYEIYRKEKAGEFELVNTVEAGVTSLKESGLTIGKEYSYKVVPTGLWGEAPEMKASIKTILAKPTGLKLSTSKKGVTVKWKAVSKATKYEIYRKMGSGAFKKIATVGKTTSYKDASVKKGKSYTYKVIAVAANKVKSAASDTKKVKFK